MKKLITILAIAAIAVTSTFAEVANTSSVTLNSTLSEKPYNISLYYGETQNFTTSALKLVENLDITKAGNTDFINVEINAGNLNKTITYTTEITENAFIGLVDGVTYTVDNNLIVRDATGANKTSYKTTVPAGPNDEQKVATFDFHWDAAENLPAGHYSTTNTISVSVN